MPALVGARHNLPKQSFKHEVSNLFRSQSKQAMSTTRRAVDALHTQQTDLMATGISTPVCKHLGIKHPIMLAGMAAVSNSKLAAAVTNAGTCVLHKHKHKHKHNPRAIRGLEI